MSSEANIDVVQNMLDAFNRGDVPAVTAAFDKDCQLDEPPEMPDKPAGGFRGHDGVREWMTNLREVGGIRFEPRNFNTSGDVIVAEWVGHGLGQASGVPFEWTSFVVLDFRNGKIVRARAFLSRDQALAAVDKS